MGGRPCIPSYQSLCSLSSPPQPSASSLAITLPECKLQTANPHEGRRLTLRVSWYAPPPFLPDDDCVVSFPKQNIDRRTGSYGGDQVSFWPRKQKWKLTCKRVFKRSPYFLRKGVMSVRSCELYHSRAASRNSCSWSVK